jgi:hypothetical protein
MKTNVSAKDNLELKRVISGVYALCALEFKGKL